ncbi:MAG: UPF0175 family protein [Deltaproteobacteria bacterium]|nr:UPF0175 family protein [Deltaproteobacteria bacterium]
MTASEPAWCWSTPTPTFRDATPRSGRHPVPARRWEAKLLLAAKLYEIGRLSSALAARLCGRGRVDFLLSLPRLGVSITNLQAEDADVELRLLRRG